TKVQTLHEYKGFTLASISQVNPGPIRVPHCSRCAALPDTESWTIYVRLQAEAVYWSYKVIINQSTKKSSLEMMHEYPAGNADVQALTLPAHSDPHPSVRGVKDIAAYAAAFVAKYEHERPVRTRNVIKRFCINQSSGKYSTFEFLCGRCRVPDFNADVKRAPLRTSEHFFTERIHSVRRQKNPVETECISCADQRAEVSGILDIVEKQNPLAGGCRRDI